jgi:hypothetical protein
MTAKARSRCDVRRSTSMAGGSPEKADIRRMFEDSLQPMWITGACGILDVNRAALRHYECSRAAFLARCAADMDAAEGLGRGAILEVNALARDTGSAAVVGRHRKNDGTVIDVALRSIAITLDGAPAALVSVVEATYLRHVAAEPTFERAGSETFEETASHALSRDPDAAASIDIESPPAPEKSG